MKIMKYVMGVLLAHACFVDAASSYCPAASHFGVIVVLRYAQDSSFFERWYKELSAYSEEQRDQECLAFFNRTPGLYNKSVPTLATFDACYAYYKNHHTAHHACETCGIIQAADYEGVQSAEHIKKYFTNVVTLLNEYYRSIMNCFLQEYFIRVCDYNLPIKMIKEDKETIYRLHCGIDIDKNHYEAIYATLEHSSIVDKLCIASLATNILGHKALIAKLMEPCVRDAHLSEPWKPARVNILDCFEGGYSLIEGGYKKGGVNWSDNKVQTIVRSLICIKQVKLKEYHEAYIKGCHFYWVAAVENSIDKYSGRMPKEFKE